MQRVKSFVFRHYWWAVMVSVIAVIALSINGLYFREPQILIASLGGLFSIAFFIQKQKLDELKLFRELFADFNARYDALNDFLDQIDRKGRIEDPQDREKIIDYFNLCGEEYFWYSAGLIPDSVWTAWCRGMYFYLSKEQFSLQWKSESETGSYYGLSLEAVKKGAGKR